MVDWTAISSIATSVAILGVAWQANETRKTARETRRTAEVATESLEIARESVQISRDLSLEAIKNRLDSRSPRLKVFAAPTSTERTRSSSAVQHSGDLGNEWPMDRVFRRTEDDHQYLTLGAQFAVENQGDATAEVWIDGPVNWLRPSGPSVKFDPSRVIVTLTPGERCEFRLEKTLPLQEWAEAWTTRSNDGNQEPARTIGEVICSDSHDDGVIDRWKLEMWCYPVEPKPGDIAGWVLRPSQIATTPDPPVVTTYVGKQRRDYYFSKEENRKMTFGGTVAK